ncbi:Bud site selection protein 6 [Rhodotorula toruloides]|uniref:BY PROTMAP: gi/472587370/gb/EMS24869.1/ actin-interacting protein 3 [Rhodosporidium toruloides NP11] gi/647401299/emb/CDR47439.1/ RHTO0S14e03708g1_1 [Rhodosporidium toruloides] n=2 Tax=Rhodotorula toruloides TaxID=5286 RepID=A0A0K3CAE6_RHOTO|nr:Bud site selection protein 6 [Rhodotorula toruloides]
MASAGGLGRSSSPTATMSTRAGSGRSTGAGPASTSNLESTITRLLVATKQLLEGLAKWSRREVDEEAISAIYVKLGNDFNVACAAFARENISMNDLMSVPSDLRVCLETCLSDPPSQATLERHLPQVRQIIIGLLHGLREKQRMYREGVTARRAREAAGTGTSSSSSGAGSAGGSMGPPMTPGSAVRAKEDLRRFVAQAAPASQSSADDSSMRQRNSTDSRRSASDIGVPSSTDARLSAALSSRSSGGPARGGSMRESSRSSRTNFEGAFTPTPTATGMPRTNSSASLDSASGPSASSSRQSSERTRRTSPPPPRQREDAVPAVPRTPTSDTFLSQSPFGGPAPVPSTIVRPPSTVSIASSAEDSHVQQYAQAASLEALKASDNLSRRASKRYSAYAIQKMTSPSPGSTSPSPASPGLDRPSRSRSGDLGRSGSGSSAGRELAGADVPRRSKSEYSRSGHARSGSRAVPPIPPIPRSYSSSTDLRGPAASPIMEEDDETTSPKHSPPVSRSGPPAFAPPPLPSSGSSSSLRPDPPPARRAPSPALPPLPTDSSPIPPQSGSPPPPSEPEYPFSVFLQVGRDVKKARLLGPPDVQSLRQLFVERFGFNPGMNDWPDIYLRDTEAGVHYELEEMSEVRAGSVLSLNIDTVDQVKQHIDRGLSTLAQDIKELRATVTAMRRLSVSANSAALGNFTLLSPTSQHPPSLPDAPSPTLRPSPSEKQFEQAAQRVLRAKKLNEVNGISTEEGDAGMQAKEDKEGDEPSTAPATPVTPTASIAPIVSTLKTQHAEVQNLRREIGVLRQVYAEFTSQTKEMFASVRVQTSHVQHLAQSKLSTDRAFVEAGTARLDAESTDLVVKVDELQDTIEQLRADTVRGVKPRPQQLSEIASALRKALETRQKLVEWLKDVKPTWSQMWSVELSKILGEQKAVETQETLLTELDEDLEDASKVLKNIQAVAKQLKTPSGGPRRELRDLGGAENAQEGLSTVLMEVKALQPDPSRRLEAIARAEKQRELDSASRTDEFARELGDFVGEGKLKKSGGVEEAERMRQARSEATLKAMFQQ